MANTSAPFGLRPWQGPGGSTPNYETEWVEIAYNDTTKIFRGDMVKQLATGYVAQWTAATVASQFRGVFWGCKYYSVSQKRTVWNKYWPGADVGTNAIVQAQIIPVSSGVPYKFIAQTANSNTTAVAVGIAAVGINADVSVGTGSTLSQQSASYVDINTFGVTATLPLRIVGIPTGYGNGFDPTTAFNNVIVQANIYQETGI
jgi:hypothetical protein